MKLEQLGNPDFELSGRTPVCLQLWVVPFWMAGKIRADVIVIPTKIPGVWLVADWKRGTDREVNDGYKGNGRASKYATEVPVP